MKKFLLLMITVVMSLNTSAQKVFGKNINTTVDDFCEFLKVEKKLKPETKLSKCDGSVRYENIKFSDVRWDSMNINYAKSNRMIHCVSFFVFSNGDGFNNNKEGRRRLKIWFDLLLLDYTQKYPQGELNKDGDGWCFHSDQDKYYIFVRLTDDEDLMCLSIDYTIENEAYTKELLERIKQNNDI